ncbi:MAG: putative multidrug ABC transporter permease YbhS [Gemmatimonadaceae bacterium]|nr:putative multidrug ABC transporter permease YbhS [Gemmatimonadaceae bacterium]
MSAFAGFVAKEVRHILRDWQTLLILIGMPVSQVLLFGYAVRSDVRGIRVAFVEPAPDAATASIRARFTADGETFAVQGTVTHVDQLESRFRDGSVRQAVIFPPMFAQRLGAGERVPVQVVTDGSDPNSGGIMEADALAILRRWEAERLVGQVADVPQALRPARIDIATRMRFNPTLESVNLFVPGLVAYVLVIVSALMTAITIVREKEMGTMEMLLVSPLRPAQVVIGKLAPYVVLGFLDVILVLAVSQVVFHVPLRGSPLLLLIESLLYILTALSMGILISTSANTERVATLAALAGLMLPTLLLSGFIFPIAALPAPLRIISNVVPARWFVVIARGIMLKGAGFAELWRETLILASITAVFLIAGIRRLAVRLG